MTSKIVLTLLLVAVSYVQVDAVIDLVIKKYEMCPDAGDTPVKHHATVKKVNATHMVADGDAFVPEDLGEDVTVKVKLDMMKDGEWKEFKTLEEKNPCKVFNKFGGDLWYEIQEKVGVQRGVCPLPKGDYKVTEHILDFAKLPVKSGPKASFRAKLQLIRDDKILLCIDSEVDSQ